MKPSYEQGAYICKVTSQALGKAGTGSTQFSLRFMVLEKKGSSQPIQQHERTMYRTITDKTIEYFMEDLEQLGFEHDSFKYLDSNTPGFQDFKGHSLEMYCKHEEDQNGEPKERWQLSRPNAIAVDPLEPAKLRELDNLYGKRLRALKHDGPKPETKPAPAAQLGVDDSDVPF